MYSIFFKHIPTHGFTILCKCSGVHNFIYLRNWECSRGQTNIFRFVCHLTGAFKRKQINECVVVRENDSNNYNLVFWCQWVLNKCKENTKLVCCLINMKSLICWRKCCNWYIKQIEIAIKYVICIQHIVVSYLFAKLDLS